MEPIPSELIQKYESLKSKLNKDCLNGNPFVVHLEKNSDSEIASICEDFIRSFGHWKKHIDGSFPFVAVRFYWAGAEVEPFIPTAVWSYAYGGDPFQGVVGKAKKVFFKEGPAFEPNSLIQLANGELGEIPHHLFDSIKDLYVTNSLIVVSKALSLIKEHPQFLSLRPSYPFHFIATPGHDEPPILLNSIFK